RYQAGRHRHLNGRAGPGRFDQAQLGLLHESRLADALDTHSVKNALQTARITTLVSVATTLTLGGRGMPSALPSALICKDTMLIMKKRIINQSPAPLRTDAGSALEYV